MRVFDFVQGIISDLQADGAKYYSQGLATDMVERMTPEEFQAFAEELDRLVSNAQLVSRMASDHILVIDEPSPARDITVAMAFRSSK